MKRSGVTLEHVADWHNLHAAVHRAARGKRHRPEVRAFLDDLEAEMGQLAWHIRQGTVPVGQMRCFSIRDPKPRVIHAPCFRERVLHHAIMARVGPVLDRSLVFDTYACRTGKGSLAAVQRAQQHIRRFPWHVKIDIRAYFSSIDHGRLKAMLRRRFKNAGLLAMLDRIIDSHEHSPGRGLPIGALTSQNFANHYLGGFDHLLLEQCRVRGMIRYMDDVVWWCDDRDEAKRILDVVRVYVGRDLDLCIKPPVQINRSLRGVSICGYRVLPGAIRLSRRRRRRYGEIRRKWENAFAAGEIDGRELQAGYSSAWAITCHAQAKEWRRAQLRLSPPREECLWI